MTTINFYNSRGAMKRGIRKMERQGYKVADTETVQKQRGCLTLCVFPPLVFFKKEVFKVQYDQTNLSATG